MAAFAAPADPLRWSERTFMCARFFVYGSLYFLRALSTGETYRSVLRHVAAVTRTYRVRTVLDAEDRS